MKIFLKILTGILGLIILGSSILTLTKVIRNGGNIGYIIGGLIGVIFMISVAFVLIKYTFSKTTNNNSFSFKNWHLLIAVIPIILITLFIYAVKRTTSQSAEIKNGQNDNPPIPTAYQRGEKELKGLGKFEINKTTIEVIDNIRNEINVDERYKKKQYNSISNKFYLPENISTDIKEIQTNYDCPELKKFSINKYFIDDIDIDQLQLLFFKDTLFQIVFLRRDFIDSAFTYNYGDPKVQFDKDSGTKTLTWENDNIAAIFFLSTQHQEWIEITTKHNIWEKILDCELETKKIRKEKERQTLIKKYYQF